jgi:hypothetical protein
MDHGVGFMRLPGRCAALHHLRSNFPHPLRTRAQDSDLIRRLCGARLSLPATIRWPWEGGGSVHACVGRSYQAMVPLLLSPGNSALHSSNQLLGASNRHSIDAPLRRSGRNLDLYKARPASPADLATSDILTELCERFPHLLLTITSYAHCLSGRKMADSSGIPVPIKGDMLQVVVVDDAVADRKAPSVGSRSRP